VTDTTPEAVAQPASAGRAGVFVLRLLSAIVVPIVAFTLLWVTFDYLRDENANRFIVVGVALVVGVGGVFFLYWGANRVIEFLPERVREGVRPYVFVGPCLVILAVFLVYPVINTILISFKDARS
jgi:alpha-glucoside transport system permease protein